MATERPAHEGMPLRLEEYPSTGVRGLRNPRDARALRTSDVALEIVSAQPEPRGTVLRVRANEPIGPSDRGELVARVIDCQSRDDGQHRITLAVLGKDRQAGSHVREAPRDARYPVSVAT